MGSIISWDEVQDRKDRRYQEVLAQLEILKDAGIIQEDNSSGEQCFYISEDARELVSSYVNSMR